MRFEGFFEKRVIRMTKAAELAGTQPGGVLSKHAETGLVFFLAHFEPQITYARKLPRVVEAVQKELKAPHWQSSAERYIIRETQKKFFYHFDHQLFGCQTLGVDPWLSHFPKHMEMLGTAFNRMEVPRLRAISLRFVLQLPLGMSHPEMCEILLDSYFADRAALELVHGKLDDALVQIEGVHKEIRSSTVIVPQTAKQSQDSFLKNANLELFVEPKYIDPCIREFHERISVESLQLTIELTKADVPTSDLSRVLETGIQWAERIADGTVRRFAGLHARTEE